MGRFDDYANAELGDKRLGIRLAKILQQLASDPTASISAACKDPYQAKAAYRFISNEKVTPESIRAFAREATVASISESRPPVLLIVQDTTELNYSGLAATDGLGSIGGKERSRGLEVHSAVAVGETGEVFGLLAQKLWVRDPEGFGQSGSRKRSLPIEGKESFKWLEMVAGAGGGFPEGTLAVHVCDREGDVYELFCMAQKTGAGLLVRKSQNRIIVDGDGHSKLNDFADSLLEAGRVTARVPRDSHSNRIARDAELSVAFGKCSVKRPRGLVAASELPESIDVYIVTARETDPPQGSEGVSWQLVTNVPTTSFEGAVARIQWYTQRWKIETFHRTLKSGCRVEELKSECADRLMKLITIYSIIALQVMLLCYAARANPDAPCDSIFGEDEWKVLFRVANKSKKPPGKPPALLDAVVMIAKLGGFLARKSDGFPGVTVIWRGLASLNTILDAAHFLA